MKLLTATSVLFPSQSSNWIRSCWGYAEKKYLLKEQKIFEKNKCLTFLYLGKSDVVPVCQTNPMVLRKHIIEEYLIKI